MTKRSSSASVQALLERYASAASAHGKGTEEGDHRATNAAYASLKSVYDDLRSHGSEGQTALLALTEDPDPWVRLWAGAHALEFAPSVGERTLLDLEDFDSPVSFDARITLQEWREGRLRFT